jgi:hypothetical protein
LIRILREVTCHAVSLRQSEQAVVQGPTLPARLALEAPQPLTFGHTPRDWRVRAKAHHSRSHPSKMAVGAQLIGVERPTLAASYGTANRPSQRRAERAAPVCVDSLCLSVVFVEAHTDDIVPIRRVMALEALIHARVFLTGKLLRHHREVFHEMARRWLVALHALLGAG